jgi:hypothetical protein
MQMATAYFFLALIIYHATLPLMSALVVYVWWWQGKKGR